MLDARLDRVVAQDVQRQGAVVAVEEFVASRVDLAHACRVVKVADPVAPTIHEPAQGLALRRPSGALGYCLALVGVAHATGEVEERDAAERAVAEQVPQPHGASPMDADLLMVEHEAAERDLGRRHPRDVYTAELDISGQVLLEFVLKQQVQFVVFVDLLALVTTLITRVNYKD